MTLCLQTLAPTAMATQDWPVEIMLYEERFHHDVVKLITSIQQQEFNLPITYEEQFDLMDMIGTYRKGKGNFWIALQNGAVIGTVGLIDASDEMAALKKMFVAVESRGKHLNVAQQLLDNLLLWARDKKIRHLYLGTTEKFLAAQRFYERNGFSIIANEDLPASIFKTRAKVDTRHYYKAL